MEAVMTTGDIRRAKLQSKIVRKKVNVDGRPWKGFF